MTKMKSLRRIQVLFINELAFLNQSLTHLITGHSTSIIPELRIYSLEERLLPDRSKFNEEKILITAYIGFCSDTKEGGRHM